MKKKPAIWLSIGVGAIAGVVAYIFFSYPEPPVEEVALARSSLAMLDKENLSGYGGKDYLEAKACYDSAMLYWQKENKRFFVFRNYDSVIRFASKSIQLSELSLENAITEKESSEKSAINSFNLAKKQLKEYLEHYEIVPVSQSRHRKLAQGKMLLEEARLALEKRNYRLLKEKSVAASSLIGPVLSYTRGILSDYFLQLPEWQRLVKAAVSRSAQKNTPLVVVDKYARRCYLYQKGKLLHTFEAELGSNWIGDKNHQGDQSTPEGLYKVVSKKGRGATKYHKALLLNYPNEEDKKRFSESKKAGVIDKHVSIGNLIEIHGHGGKGSDWTNGCVALTNSNMDKLFSLVQVGTEVVIVGSLKTIDTLTTSQ